MASSLTATAGDCHTAVQTAPAGAGAMALPAGAGLPAPRVVSERTIAVYTAAPIVTGMSVSAPAAVPMMAMPASPVPYAPPYAAAAPAPCAIPPSGGLFPMNNAWAPPPLPQKLAAAFPDPTSIERQKSAYNQRLEEELRHGSEMLKLQQKQHTDYIRQAAEAQKKQMLCHIQQNAKEQQLHLSHKICEQQRCLQKEYQYQMLALEKQANDLNIEYQRRKAQDEMLAQQYQMQKAHQEDQMQLEEQSPSKAPLWPSPPALGYSGAIGRPTSFASTADLAAYSPTALAFGSPSSASMSLPGTPNAAYAATSPVCAGGPAMESFRVPAY